MKNGHLLAIRATAIVLALTILTVLPLKATGPEEKKVARFHIVDGSSDIFNRIFKEAYRTDKHFKYRKLPQVILSNLEGLPYGAVQGERVASESTLINFTSFDCVTLVESFWAMSYTLFEYKSRKTRYKNPFRVFAKNLDDIRYFGGTNCGINERIHYFTQAMQVMQDKGLMFNVAVANGKPFKKKINYLSNNYSSDYSYDDLKALKSREKELSYSGEPFYPKRDIDLYAPLAQDGDIIALATTTDGLDVSHTGIITVEPGGILKFSHASSLHDKVVFEDDLRAYLNRRTTVTGIFVYRPIFK